MSAVSISMPEALLERIDEFADEHGTVAESRSYAKAHAHCSKSSKSGISTSRSIRGR
jgi:metal-responsive CopG/Arc/MetJ family transcriptional regulator